MGAGGFTDRIEGLEAGDGGDPNFEIGATGAGVVFLPCDEESFLEEVVGEVTVHGKQEPGALFLDEG